MQNWSLYSGIYTGIKVLNHWTSWIIIGLVLFSHFQAGHEGFEGLTSAFFIFFGAGGETVNIRKQNAKNKDGKPDFTVANNNFKAPIKNLSKEEDATYAREKTALEGLKVKDVMLTDIPTIHYYSSLNVVLDYVKSKEKRIFLVAKNKQLQGILTFQALIKAAYEKGTEITVSEIMITDFQALEPEKELSTIMYTLWKNGQNTVAPVVAGGKVLGVVSKDHIKEYLQMQVWENY